MARSGVEWDTSDMKSLITSLDRVPVRLHRAARDLVRDSGADLRDDWKDNAQATARRHGKHYPKAVTFETVDNGMQALIGPESGMLQGGMGPGFEDGSVNQPPHHDGARAADDVFPKFERRASILASDVFRGL